MEEATERKQRKLNHRIAFEKSIDSPNFLTVERRSNEGRNRRPDRSNPAQREIWKALF
jgi:hypothetical protein